MREFLDSRPVVNVPEAEYRRLLGWPRGHEPGGRAIELAAWARAWFAEHGRPWLYLRETEVDASGPELRIGGVSFASEKLRAHFHSAGVSRAMLMIASAGSSCEEHARSLWEAGRPDEYFFLEVFGSSVVEQLVASANGRVCALAESDGLRAVPHYSPGYAGWDVAEQPRLFELIERGRGQAFPETLEVLASGMPRPKKSLLAIVGLTSRPVAEAPAVPCVACPLESCQYRRARYRHAARAGGDGPPVASVRYSVNLRALRKWARERVTLVPRADGSLAATFRFDGTTCSNMGRPLAFNYDVVLGPERDGRVILSAGCAPVPGETGHEAMCAWLDDAGGLMRAIAKEGPLTGRPLADVLRLSRPDAPAGCLCGAESRAHKWGIALEAIHFAATEAAHHAPGDGSTAQGPGAVLPAPEPALTGARPSSPVFHT